MDKLRMILLDLEGNGYYVLAECPQGWVRLTKTPVNKFCAEGQITAFESHYEVSVIEHSDFYGRLPEGYTGQVL